MQISRRLVEGSPPHKKNPHSFNYAFLTKVQYVLALMQNIIRTIFVACSNGIICSVKSLSSTQVS